MTDNTLATAQNLGPFNNLQTINDFVGTTDTNDYLQFTIDSTSPNTFNLRISGNSGYFGFELYKDANGNGIIDTGETIISSSPSGQTTSTGLSVNITNSNVNGNYTKTMNFSGSLNVGTYYARVYSSGTYNTNYTLSLNSVIPSPTPDPDRVLYGTNNMDNLLTGSGNDKIFGLGGNDNINGGSGNDSLDGGTGNDNITGGSGNDIIIGGAGSDILNGGSGSDTYRFNASNEGIDMINFSVVDDTFVISASGFGGLVVGTLSAGALCLGSNFTNSSQRFLYRNTTGELYFDRDGIGPSFATTKIATLNIGLALTNSDFQIV